MAGHTPPKSVSRLPFSWNPAWYHPGASLWCLAAKLAYVGTARVAPVVAKLVGADAPHRVLTWVSSTKSIDVAREQFGLDADSARTLFLCLNHQELEERQHISLGLRWCPTCLGRWYHSVRFQDRRIRCCPWHGDRLLEGCPKCGRAVDPLGRPWHCDFCSAALAEDPEHWLAGLKAAPGHDGKWPRRAPPGLLNYEESEDGVICLPDSGPVSTAFPEGSPRAPEFWMQARLYESAASLWDTVLREHWQCALDEPYGYYRDHYSLAFKCPVAAAARAVFGQMNLDGVAKGDWPRHYVTPHADATLPQGWGTLPLAVLAAMLREIPRAWLADAFLLFGEVARAGRTVARWEPHAHAFQAKTALQSGANGPQVVTKRPESWLRATSLFCGECCPNGKAFTGHWDPLKLLLG